MAVSRTMGAVAVGALDNYAVVIAVVTVDPEGKELWEISQYRLRNASI